MQDFHNYIKSKYGDKAEMLQQILIVLFVKLRLKMFMKTSTKIKSYLTSVIIQKSQNIAMVQITYS